MISCLLWPFNGSTKNEAKYKGYFSRYWGQLWAARSEHEYSMRMSELHGKQMELPLGYKIDPHAITHASHPRQLMIYDGTRWEPCTRPDILSRTSYIAISYNQNDFLSPRMETNWGINEVEMLKVEVSNLAKSSCLEQGLSAYWLDIECIGISQAERNADLYRVADVYRGATRTVVLIHDRYLRLLPNASQPAQRRRQEERDAEELFGWQSWGDRVWTFPEALLSSSLVYKFGHEAARPISLRQLGNMAYKPDQEEMAIINGFSGKDTLERIQKQMLLKNAIWRRSSGPSISTQSPNSNAIGSGSFFSTYPAEKVYALMGFFEHRIMPDPRESPLEALARLSMANDSDRLAERMVAMLPSSISDQACWYSDDDLFKANLWDIEPKVQVAGITKSGALVLDGCRAAAIRWKNFPHLQYRVKPTFRRALCGWMPNFFAFLFFAGIGLIMSGQKSYGTYVLIAGLVGLLGSPYILAYAYAGRVLAACPWFIGVKGFMSAEDVGVRLYGCIAKPPYPATVSYSSSGSMLSVAGKSLFREGDPAQSELLASKAANVYTLVDTQTNTVYHFTAARPPSVCVYVAKEGGLGRFILCSESCTINELHRETVLRMPSYIAKSMRHTDWLAIGGTEGRLSQPLGAKPII